MRWITIKEDPADGKERHTAARWRRNSKYAWKYCEASWDKEFGWHVFPKCADGFIVEWLDQGDEE